MNMNMNRIRRLLPYNKCVNIHICNSLRKEFKRHTRLLPHKSVSINCNKYRNASEFQSTK